MEIADLVPRKCLCSQICYSAETLQDLQCSQDCPVVELVDRLAKGYARKYSLPNGYEAGDLRSDVQIKVINHLRRKEESIRSLEAVVRSVMRNHCIDLDRKNTIQVGDSDDAVKKLRRNDPLDDDPLDERPVDEFDVELDVRKAVDCLSEEDKQLVHGRFYEGKTLEELATMYDVSTTTIYNRLKRIKEQLKAHLGSYFG